MNSTYKMKYNKYIHERDKTNRLFVERAREREKRTTKKWLWSLIRLDGCVCCCRYWWIHLMFCYAETEMSRHLYTVAIEFVVLRAKHTIFIFPWHLITIPKYHLSLEILSLFGFICKKMAMHIYHLVVAWFYYIIDMICVRCGIKCIHIIF